MKIKNAKLPELRNLTNKEMDFFLYLVRRQDLRGFILLEIKGLFPMKKIQRSIMT